MTTLRERCVRCLIWRVYDRGDCSRCEPVKCTRQQLAQAIWSAQRVSCMRAPVELQPSKRMHDWLDGSSLSAVGASWPSRLSPGALDTPPRTQWVHRFAHRGGSGAPCWKMCTHEFLSAGAAQAPPQISDPEVSAASSCMRHDLRIRTLPDDSLQGL